MPGNGHLLRGVPFEKWLKTNYCGPACLAMVLNYWDATRSFSQKKIAAEIFDAERQATANSDMVWYPRSRGLASYSCRGSLPLLKEIVAAGIPVIVLTKTIKQLAKGHYRVVVGYDDDRDLVIFHDPYFGGRRAMHAETFAKVWELGPGRNQSRWMMVAVPGGKPCPFRGLQNDPLTAINLATAYYRRSDFSRSREQWEIARESLGGDPFPLYSLGMVSLREGRAGEAERYAREALRLDEKNAYALDVLALACASQGKLTRALHSLEQARQLAPDETFIRSHYVQVRAMVGEKSRAESSNKGEAK